MKRIYWIGIFLLICYSVKSQSIEQYLIASSGNHFEENNIMLSWSIGECIIETYEQNQVMLSQGFHQVTDIVNEYNEIAINNDFILHPNPAKDIIYISLPSNENSDFTLKIFNVNGQLKKNIEIYNSSTTIDISSFERGFFIVQIQDNNNKEIHHTKIIKN